MFELIQASENCYYIQSPAKAGVVVTGEGEVCLIDSGSDKDAGRRIRQHLDGLQDLRARPGTRLHGAAPAGAGAALRRLPARCAEKEVSDGAGERGAAPDA